MAVFMGTGAAIIGAFKLILPLGSRMGAPIKKGSAAF